MDNHDLAVLRENVAGVCADLCPPAQVHRHVDGAISLDRAMLEAARSLGWLGLPVPEPLGGLGLGAAGLALVAREMGRVLAPDGAIVPTMVAGYALAIAGGAVRGTQFERLVDGSAPVALSALLLSRGDEQGAKDRVALLGTSDASQGLLWCDGHVGLVGLAAGDLTPLEGWDRTRRLVTLSTIVPADTGADISAASDAIRVGYAIALAADALGTAEGALAKIVAYLKDRHQFGRPVGSFQALKHRVADASLRLRLIEHHLDQAVEAADAGAADAVLWALLAKAAATEAAAMVTGDCVQLYGGVGYTWEFDAHLHLGARLDEMFAPNGCARDEAARLLNSATQAGRTTLELAVA